MVVHIAACDEICICESSQSAAQFSAVRVDSFRLMAGDTCSRLQAKNILIAVGGRAVRLPFEGAEHAIISDDILELVSFRTVAAAMHSRYFPQGVFDEWPQEPMPSCLREAYRSFLPVIWL